MDILVNGLCDSAGKTTATVGLYQNFDKNKKISLFKPFAANDYWYDHSVVAEGLKNKSLFGHDAKTLSSFVERGAEEINPIHRLWAPESVAGRGIGVGGGGSTMLLDRVFDGESTTLVVDSEVEMPEKLDSLFDLADEVIEISSVEELNNLSEDLYLSAVEKRYKEISNSDILLVESYSDIAMPLTISPSIVISVEPGKAYLSSGEKFSQAYEMLEERWKDYSRELKTGKILDMIQSREIRIPPASLDDISKSAEAYSRVFQTVREFLG